MVHVQHHALAIQQRHPVAHVRQDQVALVAFPLDRVQPARELLRHAIDRASQAPQRIFRLLARAHPRCRGAELHGGLLQLADPRGVAAGEPEQHHGHAQQREPHRRERQPQQRQVDARDHGERLRHPHHRRAAAGDRRARRQRHVQELLAHALAEAHRPAAPARQRRAHFRAPGVVLERGELLARHFGVAQHDAGGIDQRDAIAQAPALLRGPLRPIPGRPRLSRVARREIVHQVARNPLQRGAVLRDEPAALSLSLEQRQRRERGRQQQPVPEEQPRAQRQPHHGRVVGRARRKARASAAIPLRAARTRTTRRSAPPSAW